MSLLDDLSKEIDSILRTKWETRDGEVVPEAEDLQLGNDAVLLDGTVLYADLAESTQLVKEFKNWFAAEVYKSYLICACKIIRANGGVITAFDGDRVMAVYIGGNKNTSAAKTALQISYAVQYIINSKIRETFPKIQFAVQQAVGVATGKLFIARTGIRGSNDLVWVGPAANYAAKMCALRQDLYTSYITADVFNVMHESAKYGGNPRQLM
jgi:class 3 adenylate cyclase